MSSPSNAQMFTDESIVELLRATAYRMCSGGVYDISWALMKIAADRIERVDRLNKELEAERLAYIEDYRRCNSSS